MDEPKLSPPSHSISPFFMEDDDPEKFVKKGEVTWSACDLFDDIIYLLFPSKQCEFGKEFGAFEVVMFF